VKKLLVVTACLETVTGAALPALGVACWVARDDERSGAARGLLVGILLYNVATVALLVYSDLRLTLSGLGLWPAVVLHLALAIWCTRFLRPTI
jgi:hypothetical protein